MPVLARDALVRRGHETDVTVCSRCISVALCACGALLGWTLLESPVACIAFTLACACMGSLVICDVQRRILPTGFVAAMLLFALVFRVAEGELLEAVFLLVAGGCIASLLYAANSIHMNMRDADLIGAGDIRMVVPLMLFTGAQGAGSGLCAMSLVAGTMALGLLATGHASKNATIPLAPCLAAFLLCGTLIPFA